MFDGAAILYPSEGAMASGCSVNHGSGRVKGRKEAKRDLGEYQDVVNEEMATVRRVFDGVEVVGITSSHSDIPLDECAHVYKNLDAVLDVLAENNVARVDSRLYLV